eukprot:COSAG01_NODE_10998_length_2030_cov_2.434490_2_plen_238_part_00
MHWKLRPGPVPEGGGGRGLRLHDRAAAGPLVCPGALYRGRGRLGPSPPSAQPCHQGSGRRHCCGGARGTTDGRSSTLHPLAGARWARDRRRALLARHAGGATSGLQQAWCRGTRGPPAGADGCRQIPHRPDLKHPCAAARSDVVLFHWSSHPCARRQARGGGSTSEDGAHHHHRASVASVARSAKSGRSTKSAKSSKSASSRSSKSASKKGGRKPKKASPKEGGGQRRGGSGPPEGE